MKDRTQKRSLLLAQSAHAALPGGTCSCGISRNFIPQLHPLQDPDRVAGRVWLEAVQGVCGRTQWRTVRHQPCARGPIPSAMSMLRRLACLQTRTQRIIDTSCPVTVITVAYRDCTVPKATRIGACLHPIILRSWAFLSSRRVAFL